MNIDEVISELRYKRLDEYQFHRWYTDNTKLIPLFGNRVGMPCIITNIDISVDSMSVLNTYSDFAEHVSGKRNVTFRCMYDDGYVEEFYSGQIVDILSYSRYYFLGKL